jgi:hypothetical protein
MQAVTREDRRRFVECTMHGRLAAAHIVIVHRRQIVVDQRIDMDCLDRAGGARGAFAIDPEQAGGGEDQQRPQPFAATDRCMPHRLVQFGARIVGYREHHVEAAIDLRAHLGQRGFERRRGCHGADAHAALNGATPAGRPSESSRIASIRACAASSRSVHF